MEKQDEETVEAVPSGTAEENQAAVDFEPLIIPQTNSMTEEDTPVVSTQDDAPEIHIGELPLIVPETNEKTKEDTPVASTEDDVLETHIGEPLIVSQTDGKTEEDTPVASTKDEGPEIHIRELPLIVPEIDGKTEEVTPVASTEDDVPETQIEEFLIVSQTDGKTKDDTAPASTKDEGPEIHIEELPFIVPETDGKTEEEDTPVASTEDDVPETHIGEPLIVSQTDGKTEEDTPVAFTKDDAPGIYIGELALIVPHTNGKTEDNTPVASTEYEGPEIHVGEIPFTVPQTDGKTEEDTPVAFTEDDVPGIQIGEPLIVSQTDGKTEEDTPVASTLQDDALETHIGVPGVQHEDAPISTDWNNAPVGSWTSVKAPLDLENGDTAAPATTESGVLGSAPAAEAVEKPPPQVYNFYMVKVPRPVDRQGRAEINAAGQKWQDQNDTVQEVRAKRNEAFEKRKAALQVEWDWFLKMREKLDQIIPLRDSLKKIKEACHGKSRDIPTSEEDLDNRIASLEWRIEHDSIPLKEEKQLMRDIKQLQSSRKSIRANASLIARANEAMSQREDLENALKPLEAELKQLESERMAARLQVEKCDQECDKLNAAVQALQNANSMMQEAYAHHRTLKYQEYLRMKYHYDNKREIQDAKLLASKQYNSKEVEAFCSAQVERMLETWNTKAEFRKTYVKDNEVSTVRRFGTWDGRSLGPDETRPVLAKAEAPFFSGPASQQNGSRASASAKGTTPGSAGKVETPAAAPAVDPAPAAVAQDKPAAKREPPVVEVVKSPEELEREAAKPKEQRRATEMAKAKEAEERKKRAAERAQAKAQVWAQKEAERKQMEKEKKARKKYAAVTPADFGNSAPTAESQYSAPEEPKVRPRQRRRGVTSTQKQAAARVARANAPPIPVRVKQQKLFGMPMQYVVGAAIAVLLAVLFYLYFRGNF